MRKGSNGGKVSSEGKYEGGKEVMVKTKTREDAIRILTDGQRRYNWCESGVRRCLNFVRKFPPGTPFSEIGKRFPPGRAFFWGFHVGDRDIMRDRVTDEWAFRWGYAIGDRHIMRDRVTSSEWSYKWGLQIGDRELMRERVTDSEWASYWGQDIGDHDVMRDRVAGSDGFPIGTSM